MTPQTRFRIIATIQNVTLAIGILILIALPPFIAFHDGDLPGELRDVLFGISHISVTLVMSIRPLANLLPRVRILAQLVILRKGFGVLSASIIIAFFLARIIADGSDAITQIFTPSYWSLQNYAVLAHLGDITAIILLVTSNNYMKRLLKRSWKRVQKTAYIYFYAGALYASLSFNDRIAQTSIVIVTILTISAAIVNRRKKHI